MAMGKPAQIGKAPSTAPSAALNAKKAIAGSTSGMDKAGAMAKSKSIIKEMPNKAQTNNSKVGAGAMAPAPKASSFTPTKSRKANFKSVK